MFCIFNFCCCIIPTHTHADIYIYIFLSLHVYVVVVTFADFFYLQKSVKNGRPQKILRYFIEVWMSGFLFLGCSNNSSCRKKVLG